MQFNRILSILAGSIIAPAIIASSVVAESYPSDTVHIVLPWRAGGGTDTIARGFAAALESQIDQAVVVDNLTGGVGDRAHNHIINSEPNGLQLLFNGSSDMNAVTMFRGTDYDYRNFDCVGGLYNTPTWILAHKDRGLNSIADLLAAAVSDPENTTIGVSSLGSPHFVLAKALLGNNGVNARIIALDGGGPLKKAILANQVTAGVIHSPVLLDAVKSGDVIVLGAGGSLENINYGPVRGTETISNYNVDVEIGVIRGLYVPKGTPEDIRAAAEEMAKKAAESEAFKEFGLGFGFAPVWIDGASFCEIMETENAAYKDIKAKYID